MNRPIQSSPRESCISSLEWERFHTASRGSGRRTLGERGRYLAQCPAGARPRADIERAQRADIVPSCRLVRLVACRQHCVGCEAHISDFLIRRTLVESAHGATLGPRVTVLQDQKKGQHAARGMHSRHAAGRKSFAGWGSSSRKSARVAACRGSPRRSRLRCGSRARRRPGSGTSASRTWTAPGGPGRDRWRCLLPRRQGTRHRP